MVNEKIEKSLSGKIIFIFVLAITSIVFASQIHTPTSYAADNSVHVFGGRLNEAISSIEWNKSDWIKENSFYNKAANAGVKLWEDSSNKITFKGEAPSGTLDEIRFKKNIYDVDHYKKIGVLAYTRFFDSIAGKEDKEIFSPYSKNWDYARIYFCKETIDKLNLSQSETNVISAHEIGHAFGLAHNPNNPKYIMTQKGSGRTTTKPHSNEVAVVINKNK